MPAATNLSRLATQLLVVGLTGAIVTVAAWLLAGGEALAVGLSATGAGLAIAAFSEVVGRLIGGGPEAAVTRLLATMLVRGGGAAAALVLTALALETEPRVVGMIAIPIYMALLGGEVFDALAAKQPVPSTIAMEK